MTTKQSSQSQKRDEAIRELEREGREDNLCLIKYFIRRGKGERNKAFRIIYDGLEEPRLSRTHYRAYKDALIDLYIENGDYASAAAQAMQMRDEELMIQKEISSRLKRSANASNERPERERLERIAAGAKKAASKYEEDMFIIKKGLMQDRSLQKERIAYCLSEKPELD